MATNNNKEKLRDAFIVTPPSADAEGASVATTAGLSAPRSSFSRLQGGGRFFTLERLVNRVLDPLREAWGSPIIVTSGYRCPELNARVGGARTSYHLRGMAADIRPKNGFLYELYSFVERMFVDNKMPITECYIDHRKGYIHIAYDAEDNNTWPFITK